MAQLYLTRKMIQNQQFEALEASASNSAITFPTNLLPLGSNIYSKMSFGTGTMLVDNNVEDLEMLLEAYFMQLQRTHHKILSVSPVLLLMDVTCSAMPLDRYMLNRMLLVIVGLLLMDIACIGLSLDGHTYLINTLLTITTIT